MSSLRFMRSVELFLRAIFFFLPEDMIENIARPKRWKKRIQKDILGIDNRYSEYRPQSQFPQSSESSNNEYRH